MMHMRLPSQVSDDKSHRVWLSVWLALHVLSKLMLLATWKVDKIASFYRFASEPS